jgi:hypothetical protein
MNPIEAAEAVLAEFNRAAWKAIPGANPALGEEITSGWTELASPNGDAKLIEEHKRLRLSLQRAKDALKVAPPTNRGT